MFLLFYYFLSLKNELERGSIILKSGDVPDTEKFEELIKETAFFKDHKCYFRIRGVCSEEDNQQVWFGWVESRIRKCILFLFIFVARFFNIVAQVRGANGGTDLLHADPLSQGLLRGGRGAARDKLFRGLQNHCRQE